MMEERKISKEMFEFVQIDKAIHDKKFDTKPIGYFKDAWIRFRKNKSSVAGAIIIALLALGAVMKKRRRALAAAAAVPADADVTGLDLNKGEAAEALQTLEAETKADEEAAKLKAEISRAKFEVKTAEKEKREEE